MLAAALAFPFHVTLMTCAQAAAAAGHVSGPAVAVSGPVHQHGAGTQIAHLHGGNNAVGHTHSHHPAQHHDDADDAAPSQFWSLGCAAAVMPAPEFLAALSLIEISIEVEPQQRLAGVNPEGLHRPPSTPGIA